MKHFFAGAFAFMYFALQAQEAKDYATIHIFFKDFSSYLGSMNAQSFPVTINGNPVCELGKFDLVNYKIHSEGNMLVEVGMEDISDKVNLTVEHGKEYFVAVSMRIKLPFKFMVFEVNADEAAKIYKGRKELKPFPLEESKSHPVSIQKKEGVATNAKSGSGFLVSADGYIATNYHVIEGGTKITVKGVGGDFSTPLGADVVMKDENNDLALLKLKNQNIKFDSLPYSFKSGSAETGEDVFILGYPLKDVMGEEVKLTTGVVSSKTGYQGSISSYQVSAAAQPGNSGGPLFDKNGNLLGVVNAKIGSAENVTYGVKVNYVKALLEMTDSPAASDRKDKLAGLPLSEQIKKLKNVVYIIEVDAE